MAALIDTHAHLDFPQFKEDLDRVLEKAGQAGVKTIINVGTDEKSSRRALALSRRHRCIWAAVGIHPHFAAQVSPRGLAELARLAEDPGVVAVGETGLDFYRNLSPPEVQAEIFRGQLRLAEDAGKPVIIHSREAHDAVLKILREEPRPRLKGVMHCFSGDLKTASAFLELGFFLSVAGPVTYPRSRALRELLREIPLERLLLETDAPYLSPQPYRGLRNEPAFIRATYERVALALEMDLDRLARLVLDNAVRLFGAVINYSTGT